MISISNLTVSLAEEDKQILSTISLTLEEGLVYALRGRNGSGKSTLLQTLMNNPQFEIESGDISMNGKSILGKDETERSLLGIYLANQHPPEIEGVSFLQFLRLIYNVRRDKKVPVFAFKEIAESAAKQIKFPLHLLNRNLNEGFSGGEKKKAEILQALLLEPTYLLLDELDSGLDKQSIKEVFTGINNYKKENPKVCIVIVSHYDSVFDYLPADKQIEMSDGKIIDLS